MGRGLVTLAVGAAALYCALAVMVGAAHPRTVGLRLLAYAENADSPPRPLRFNRITVPGTSGRRVYLLHGLNEGTDFWLSPPYEALTNRLIARQDEIVFTSLPRVLARNLEGGGQEYCDAFGRWFAATEKQLGPARDTMVVGASWGAWHAMQIGDKVDRMVLFKPATEPSRLNEYWWIDRGACPLTAAPKSIALYAPTDPRVGDATAALKAAGIPTISSAKADHGTAERDVYAALRWISETDASK